MPGVRTRINKSTFSKNLTPLHADATDDSHSRNSIQLPAAIEAECAILGSILESADLYPKAQKRFGFKLVFHDLRNKTVWESIQAVSGSGVDSVSVYSHLAKARHVENAGGIAYLQELVASVTSHANFDAWLDLVWNAYLLRKMVEAANRIISKANTEDALEIARGSIADLIKLCEPATVQLLDPLDWDSLFLPIDPSENLLGNRFLERGQGFIEYAPSGVGKSVAALQMDLEWAAGLAGFHIKPAHALKIVMLQTEDSVNDTREALAGILSSTIFTAEAKALIRKNLIILPPVPGGSESQLGDMIHNVGHAYKPDLITVNPLHAFCTGDPSRDLGRLLYQTVDPAIKAVRTGFHGVHHTPKTNNRDTSDYGDHDHQYLAAGDARVANWPRSMMLIEPVRDGLYRFRITKRWQRSGWTWDGKPTNERYFKHAKGELRWLDAMPEEISRASSSNHADLASILPRNDQTAISRQRVRVLAKEKLKIGKNPTDEWLKLCIEDGLIVKVNTINDNNRKEVMFRCA